MLFLVKDIEDHAQLEADSIVINLDQTDILNLINECIRFLQFKAQQKGIHLFFLKPRFHVPLLVTDSNRLKQIVINLISNAVKYTEEGFVKVSLQIKPETLDISV